MRIKLLVLALSAFAGQGAATAQVNQSLDVQVIEAPKIVRIGATDQLVYELHLTNFSSHPVELNGLVIEAGNRHTPLKTYSRDELPQAMDLVGPPEANARIIPTGRRAVVYVGAPVPAAFPREPISHRLTLSKIDTDEADFTISGGAATLETAALPRLSPPLRGGPWVAVYDPAMERGHRRVFYATEGSATLPGRFAIDFMKVDASGKLSAGDADIPANHHGFGAAVLAVADGTIVAVRDDVPDPATAKGRTNPAIADASGNYVMLDIGGGRIATYEHLKQGAPVEVGDRVKAGHVIGFLGFTGQASAPHLHFHLADRASILGAEGQPYVFASLTRLGRYETIDSFFRGETWPPADRSETVRDSFPPPNLVVRFPGD
ncbi:MAG TPA: M23 family metallopeptidase [Sphingopyxis sp.]|uniref:M23 family metallopeptidase n=1 Tax=Sphingopyxis sp. TaxID=1908224 RepID=UPI002C62EDDB|nr:M23 family metallopeptidase [Sphingopyxis sp.]HWW56092.1 M23 family metallopeptidase [Sphingopyxis sp.]